MTDTDLRIAIAKRLGWACVEQVHDRLLGVAPIGIVAVIPDYPADPREWAVLLEEMRDSVDALDPSPTGEWIIETWDDVHVAPTLGRAVCMAWLAWKGVG